MIENKVSKAIVEVGKDVAQDLIRPTSKSVGENLGLFVDGVMGWLGYWGQKQAIKREVYLVDYKKKMYEKIDTIPNEKLQEPKMRIVGPAIEASKFYIEEEAFREMFAELIASTCNIDYADKVHPAFPEIIKQLSPLDVKFLELFKGNRTFPCCEIYAQHVDKSITPCLHVLLDIKNSSKQFDYQEELLLTETIENLGRLGLMIKNGNVLELNYDYNQFKTHWLYDYMLKANSTDSEIKTRKYRIELTQLGIDFVNCCFGK